MQLRKVANPSFGSECYQAFKLLQHPARSWLSYRLETMCLLNARLFSERKVADKNLEDILSDCKENKVKYPVLGAKRHNRKAPLRDLIRELKGEPVQNSTKVPVYKVNTSIGTKDITYGSKNNSARRVSVLNKHFDLRSLQQRKDLPSLHKQKRIEFVPDDTEVGELLKSLISKGKFTEVNVKEIMANIKPKPVSNEKNLKEKSDKDLSLSPHRVRPFTSRSKLFDGPQSFYFDASLKSEEHSSQQIFVSIHELKWKELVNSTVPKLGPTNAFEVLMLEADRLWKFPIDNEIGLDEEDQSTFEDHVFLSEYLEIFTMKGQVRRFMELVIIGLQQNPYLSVKEKVDKIYWFKDYFDKFSDSDLEF